MERKILVAKQGEVEVGRTKSFRFGPHAAIVYNDAGVLKAYMNRCTHMGGPVELKDKKGQPVFGMRRSSLPARVRRSKARLQRERV